MSKNKSKKKTVIILVVVGVVVVLGVVGYLRMRANIEQAGKTTYEIVDVSVGTIEVKVKGAGSVEPLHDNTVYASVSATVKQVLAENGDEVRAGDVIAVLKSDALETQRLTVKQQIADADAMIRSMRGASGSDKITALADGVVKAVYAAEGDSVDAVADKHGALALICPDEVLKVQVPYTSGVELGDKVRVSIGTDSVDGVVTGFRAGIIDVKFGDNGFELGETALVTGADGSELGNGSVSVAHPVYVSGRGGSVKKVHVKVGDEVSSGDKMFTLEGEILSGALYSQIDHREDLQNQLDALLEDIESLTVRADTDGVVSGLSLKVNQTVQPGTALFTVKSSDTVKIDVKIDELDIAGVEVGDKADLTFDALPEKSFSAEIVKINPIGVSENNVTKYTVTLSLEDALGVMIGMSADVQIVAQQAQNVLLIPIEAIQVVNGEKFVVFESDIDQSLAYTPATHKVVTGITDGVNIEIVEGLVEGDRVAVPQVKPQSLQEQMWSNSPNGSQAMGRGPMAPSAGQ